MGGKTGIFWLYLLSSYSNKTNLLLVIVPHGDNGNGKSVEFMTDMSAEADSARFIAVYSNSCHIFEQS